MLRHCLHMGAVFLLPMSLAWAVGGETLSSATPIAFSPGGTYTDSGSTATAVNDYDSSVAARYCQVDTHSANSFGGKDVMYSFTLSQSTAVSVDLCTTSNWNSVVGITLADGTLLSACNDNSTLCTPATTRSTIPGCCLSAGSYFVVVDGYGGATVGGPYTLTVGFGAEACASACDLYASQTLNLAAPDTVTGSTVGAPQIYSSMAGEQGVDIVIPHGGEWNFDACDAATSYAADLYLFNAPPCEGGQLMASNTSGTCALMAGTGRLLNVGLQAGSYHLMVSHTALLEGSFGLSVSETLPARATQGGPDGYGYLWRNSLDAAGPDFNWVDIRTVGTPVNFSSSASTAGPFPLGLDFPFYDSVHAQCYLSSDGFLAFEALASSYGANNAIPNAALPNAVVAPFWDDLAFTPGVGQAYTWFDSANRRFVASWVNFTKAGEPISFQLILHENGDILFQYLTMPVLQLNSASAGIEDTGGAQGLRLSLNNVGGALYGGVASLLVRPTDMMGPAIAHTPLVDTPQVGPWTVEALLEDPSGVASASLSYRVESGSWTTMAMSPGAAALWSAQIPALQGTVDYYLTATDGASPPRTSTSATWSFVARPTRGGPDSYGYRWMSSRDTAGHAPQWVDISAVGTPQTIANNSSVGPIDLGMAFPHYDTTQSSCVISSEGFLCFNSFTGYQNINYPMPSVAQPNGILAAFWDDLSMGAGSQLLVWADSTGGRFVASWLNFLKGTTPLSFQLVLEVDGDVWVNYLDLPNGLVNSATVGLENQAGSVGVQVNNNNAGALLADGLSLRISRPTDVSSPVLTHTPLVDTESFGPWTLAATVEDPSGVASLTLHWRTDNGAWSTVAGQFLGGTAWTAELPAISGQIQYYFVATDAYEPSHSATSATWSFLRRHTHGGPDAFGHTWVNSRDPQGPAFQWEDISTVGTPLTLTNLPYSNPITLPFAFPFFNQLKSTVRVNCHGALEFEASSSGYSSLPQTPPNSATPNDLIAVYWASLNARPSGGGLMWTWHDTATNRFLVQWRGHSQAGGPLVEVQAVLEPSGRISIRLLNVDEAVLNSSTVGMENATGSDGFTVHRLGTGSAVADSLCFLLATPGPVIAHSPLVDSLLPGPWTVEASITDAQGVGQANLEWRLDNGVWQSTPMAGAPPLWSAVIPDILGVVDYRITAVNNLGLSTTSPTWRFAHRITSAETDSSGYAWINSRDAAGPPFQWADISSTGTPMQLFQGYSIPFALGFTMPFYGNWVDSLRVSGNGLLVLDMDWSFNITYNRNLPLAQASPNGIIAPLWDNFSCSSSYYPGTIWVKAEAQRFIVQYHMVADGGTRFFDFQVLLHADGGIRFNYLNVDELDVASATVGLENVDGDRGVMVNRLDLGGAIADSLSVELSLADRIGPDIAWVSLPDQTSTQPIPVRVTLHDLLSGVSAADLWWRPLDGPAQVLPMSWEGGEQWVAQLPAQPDSLVLDLQVVAWDGHVPANAAASAWERVVLYPFDACQEPLPANHSAWYLSAPSDDAALASGWPILAERFHADEAIVAVNFRANHEVVSGGGWVTCTLDTLWLAAEFRGLDGELLRRQMAHLVGTPSVDYDCGNCNDGILPSWDYRLVLDTPLDLADGWLSLRGMNPEPCWLMWVFSQAGAGNGSSRLVQDMLDPLRYYQLDLGYCLETGLTCTPPLDLNAVWTTEGCQLSWQAVLGAGSYQVYSSATVTGTFTALGAPVASPSFLDASAGANSTRLYQVRAICP